MDDKVDVKITWGLVWALWWRMMLITIGIYVVIGLVAFAMGVTTLIPFLQGLVGIAG
jgi:hypothetical protein